MTSHESTKEDEKLALIIISEFISDKLSASLCESLGYSFSELTANNNVQQNIKRKEDWEQELEVNYHPFICYP